MKYTGIGILIGDLITLIRFNLSLYLKRTFLSLRCISVIVSVVPLDYVVFKIRLAFLPSQWSFEAQRVVLSRIHL